MVVPVTAPFNAVDCPAVNEVDVGLSVTLIVGTNATVMLALLVVSTTLVAVTVMFCEALNVVGTV